MVISFIMKHNITLSEILCQKEEILTVTETWTSQEYKCNSHIESAGVLQQK